MKKKTTDPVLRKAAKLFEKSGKTLEELGREMGYSPGTARRAAWQFLNKIDNPTLDALRRFAKALGVEVKVLFSRGIIMKKEAKDRFGNKMGGTRAAIINACLSTRSPKTLQQLAKKLGLKPSTISPHLTSLKKKGYADKVQGGWLLNSQKLTPDPNPLLPLEDR